MTVIFVSQIAAGAVVSFVDGDGTHYRGLAVRAGRTHATESYSLPPSTPFVEVEVGDGSHRGPIFHRQVVASQLREVRPHCDVSVVRVSGARQPWRAECSCGWVSRSYAADHAAQIMADDHTAEAV